MDSKRRSVREDERLDTNEWMNKRVVASREQLGKKRTDKIERSSTGRGVGEGKKRVRQGSEWTQRSRTGRKAKERKRGPKDALWMHSMIGGAQMIGGVLF